MATRAKRPTGRTIESQIGTTGPFSQPRGGRSPSTPFSRIGHMFPICPARGNAPGFDIMDRMKRHEGPQTPYEVYCYNCRVTAATGTSRCVHCGGRLSGRAQRGGAAVVTELPDGDALAARGLARRKPRLAEIRRRAMRRIGELSAELEKARGEQRDITSSRRRGRR